ncbi:hypothetical protein SASPL_127916 [Salvia splendens]|uniref:Uncharacterized protein n=1 Tax=Salvia splendens TaxID=180675 RepID=A0A8X8ZN05_SALSN|nr:hypothetical protein SASPL_127916 [Salvia splendens]
MVAAPLGIVNAVELTFVAMFVVLMIWSLANYLHVSFGHLHMHTPGVKVEYELDFVRANMSAGILFDCKGSDVGVPVSGPKTMRHAVAKICASGLAKNLHFEAMSFDW